MISPLHYLKYARPNLKILNNSEWRRRINLGRSVKCSQKKPSGGSKEEKVEPNKNETRVYPEQPTSCCMSGCANCVWLDYAEKLTEYFKDSGEQAIKEINEKVTDENIKAFLLHELRMRNIKPK